ncbi:MAG: prolyl aminopeptidase [Pseudomonadota bacterium]
MNYDHAFLYPPIEPSESGHLEIEPGTTIYWETCGNPKGRPVVYLHGGPGAGTNPVDRRYFDPDVFRIVLLHQRGAGLSRPLAETKGNTTQANIADLEALREHLGIERWFVTGGSWGSILGLAYGETHPDRCLGFAFRGVILARQKDIDWWWEGTRMLFPDHFDAMCACLPEAERDNPLHGLYARLMDDDPVVHGPVSEALARFSFATVAMHPIHVPTSKFKDPAFALPLARFFTHYCENGFFLRDAPILDNVHKINHLPCHLAAGRYDVTTPVESAWLLHRAWPGSTLKIAQRGAHALVNAGLARAFLEGIEKLKHV